MNKAKEKFNNYIQENAVHKVIVLKDSAICLPSGAFTREIEKRERNAIQGVFEKIKYAPMVIDGKDIEKTDFYCAGVYDERYRAGATIEYYTALEKKYDKRKSTSSIFICAKSAEILQHTAEAVLDVLDEAYNKGSFDVVLWRGENPGAYSIDVAVGPRSLITPKRISTGVFLTHSKDAFNSLVLAVDAKAKEAEDAEEME